MSVSINCDFTLCGLHDWGLDEYVDTFVSEDNYNVCGVVDFDNDDDDILDFFTGSGDVCDVCDYHLCACCCGTGGVTVCDVLERGDTIGWCCDTSAYCYVYDDNVLGIYVIGVDDGCVNHVNTCDAACVDGMSLCCTKLPYDHCEFNWVLSDCVLVYLEHKSPTTVTVICRNVNDDHIEPTTVDYECVIDIIDCVELCGSDIVSAAKYIESLDVCQFCFRITITINPYRRYIHACVCDQDAADTILLHRSCMACISCNIVVDCVDTLCGNAYICIFDSANGDLSMIDAMIVCTCRAMSLCVCV